MLRGRLSPVEGGTTHNSTVSMVTNHSHKLPAATHKHICVTVLISGEDCLQLNGTSHNQVYHNYSQKICRELGQKVTLFSWRILIWWSAQARTHIPNTCTHTHTEILVDFNLVACLVNRQNAKLNSPPNFLAIRYRYILIPW